MRPCRRRTGADVVAAALDEAHERHLPPERPLATDPVPEIRPVERDMIRAPSEAREVVRAATAPRVVGLPRVHRHLDQHARVLLRRVDDQVRRRRFARLRAVEQEHADQVVAADPARIDRERVCRRPARVHVTVDVHRLLYADLRAAATRQARDLARAEPPVPAEAVDEHPVARALRGRDVQRNRVARHRVRRRRVDLCGATGRAVPASPRCRVVRSP